MDLRKLQLDRCLDEQVSSVTLLLAGHADRRGLMQAVDDWVMEEALLRLAYD